MARNGVLASAQLSGKGAGADRSAARGAGAGGAASLVRGFAPVFGCVLMIAGAPLAAASNKVRITNLGDVAFGTVLNLSADAVRSQSVCLFADTNTNGYNITASGTGPGGAFELSSGPAALTYEVRWSSVAGQSTGVQLTPNVPLTSQVSGATHQSCANGPATSASLVVVLRSTALSSALAGTYNGALTLVVGPE